ncbi:MAG: hypothetical protein ACMUEM_02155 [Flavobacteriales bacterium AspAUS03]
MTIRITFYKSNRVTKKRFPVKIICERKEKRKGKILDFILTKVSGITVLIYQSLIIPEYQALYEVAFEWENS